MVQYVMSDEWDATEFYNKYTRFNEIATPREDEHGRTIIRQDHFFASIAYYEAEIPRPILRRSNESSRRSPDTMTAATLFRINF